MRVIFLVFIALSLICVTGAAADNDIWIVPGASGDVISVWKGVTTTFQVTTVTRDAGGALLSIGSSLSPSDVVWSSSNPSVGTFSGTEFSALNDGATQITASYNGWADTTTVYVTSSPRGTIYLNPTTVAAGETAHFIFAAYDTSSGVRLTDAVLQTRWSVADAGGGSFSDPATGDYTAPAAVGTYQIEARGTASGYTTYYATALVNVILPDAPDYTITGPSSALRGENVVFTPSHAAGCPADSVEWTLTKSGAPDITFTSWTLAYTFSGTGDYILRMVVKNTTYGLSSPAESIGIRISEPVPTYVPPSTIVPTAPNTVSPSASPTVSPLPTGTPTATDAVSSSGGGNLAYIGTSENVGNALNDTNISNVTNATMAEEGGFTPFWCPYCWWFFAGGLLLGCLLTLLVVFIVWKKRMGGAGAERTEL